MYTFSVRTDQCEVVAADFPDQTGFFAIPPLYVHQLPIHYCYNGLQATERETEMVIKAHTSAHKITSSCIGEI